MYREIRSPRKRHRLSNKEWVPVYIQDIERARSWVGRIEQAMRTDPDFQKTIYKRRMLRTIRSVQEMMPRDLKELKKLDALSEDLLDADNRWRKEQIQFLKSVADDPDLQNPKLQSNLRTQIEKHKEEVRNNDRALQ